MKRFLSITAFFLLTAWTTHAQWIGGQLSEREKQAFQQRVKEMGQFMKRFNNAEKEVNLAMNTVPMADSSKQIFRTRALLHLLDYNKYSQVDDAEQARIMAFINQVNPKNGNPVYLDFYDQHWYAKVAIEASFKGQTTNLSLILKNESTADKVSKWVIVSAIADFLTISSSNKDIFLPPNSDGTNFIGLTDALADKANASAYATKDFHADPLTLFFFHLQAGNLQIGAVKKVAFHLLQVEGWAVVVEEFNETQLYSSGWLIANIQPISDRKTYKEHYLNLR